ncbi:hypothetical protein [Sphingomonas sp.]|uniref:hypothetical protein n=1 Tax=Sphingomonas sp. TaxID=28214 RepID=UPI0025D67DA1|nr:hypothetical protein [Sphingomonas sp.]MBV9528530.1 hypothetical protein [Sphingomonas sp.]
MSVGVFEPIASLIALIRAEVPSVDELRANPGTGPFGPKVTVPLAAIHIFMQEIERMGVEITRLEGLVVLASAAEGNA